MPPRYQSTLLTFEEKARNLFDHLGQPAHRGHARVDGGSRSGSGLGQSLTQNAGPRTGAQGQILILSATADSIASGGDYLTFDAETYRHGFDGYYGDAQAVVWPTSFAGASIQVEFEWNDYEGGGTVEIEVDGAVPAWGLVGAGTSGSGGIKRRSVHIDAGSSVKIKVTQESGSAQICDVFVEFAIPDPTGPAVETSGVLETFWVDSMDAAGTTSSMTLESGVSYRVVVTGNFDPTGEETFPYGDPDTVLFPSDGKTPTQAAADADTYYASSVVDDTGGHFGYLLLNLGSGSTHVEPDGGAVTSPATGHAYTYTVVGGGSPVSVSVYESDDEAYALNNGQLRVDIYAGGS